MAVRRQPCCPSIIDVRWPQQLSRPRIDLVAVAGRENTIDRYLDTLPGEYRTMQVNRMQTRAAEGTVLVGGEALEFEAALISKHSSNFHFIGH